MTHLTDTSHASKVLIGDGSSCFRWHFYRYEVGGRVEPESSWILGYLLLDGVGLQWVYIATPWGPVGRASGP